MADAVDTVVVIEELDIPPPASRTSPTSSAAGEILIVGLATLESASFTFAGTGVCRPDLLLASPRQAKARGWLSYLTGATNGGLFSSAKGVIHGGVLQAGWDRSVEMWCVVALRGSREPYFRYLLTIAN